MGLGRVGFADVAGGVGPCDVEIPQCDKSHIVRDGVATKHELHAQLARAVGVDRVEAVGFFDRASFGRTVNGGRRTEDERLDVALFHRFQERQATDGVVGIILAGLLDRLAGFDERSEVNHRVDLVLGQRASQGLTVGHIAHDQLDAFDRFGMPLAQVVIHHGRMSGIRQRTHHVRPNIPRATCQQYIHRVPFIYPSDTSAGTIPKPTNEISLVVYFRDRFG